MANFFLQDRTYRLQIIQYPKQSLAISTMCQQYLIVQQESNELTAAVQLATGAFSHTMHGLAMQLTTRFVNTGRRFPFNAYHMPVYNMPVLIQKCYWSSNAPPVFRHRILFTQVRLILSNN
jgi:hypothetical protein